MTIGGYKMIITKASFFTKLSLALLLVAVKPAQASSSFAKGTITGAAIAFVGLGACELYNWWVKLTPKQIFEKQYRDYLAGKCDVNYIFDNGETLLMQALKFSCFQEAHNLLEDEKTNLESLDNSGTSILIYAIRTQNIKLITKIIDYTEASMINRAERSGFTPLMYAVIYYQDNNRENSLAIINLLLDMGANRDQVIVVIDEDGKNIDGRNVYGLAYDLGRANIGSYISKYFYI